MEINELRIGNTIKFLVSGEIAPLYWKNLEFMSRDNIEIKDYFEPVKITEEWFNGLNIEKGENGHPEFMNVLKSYVIRVGDYIQIRVNSYKHRAVYITYIHEFQNLHFALTGEELPIG